MRNGFLISAALAFFLMILVGYVKDHSLMTTLGRALAVYAVILALGAIYDAMDIEGSSGKSRPADTSAATPSSGSENELVRINREMANDPGKVAQTIKKMIK